MRGGDRNFIQWESDKMDWLSMMQNNLIHNTEIYLDDSISLLQLHWGTWIMIMVKVQSRDQRAHWRQWIIQWQRSKKPHAKEWQRSLEAHAIYELTV